MENEKVLIATDRKTLFEVLSEVMIQKDESKKRTDIDISEKKTRREAAKFLGISYQTACNWTKSGILKEHGQNRKRFYLRSELIEAMQK